MNCEETEEKGYWLASNVKINVRTLLKMLFRSHFAAQFELKNIEIKLFQAMQSLFHTLNINLVFKILS